jgi:hypothetical protein
MSADSPKFSDRYLALSKDPHFQLQARLSGYLETENPLYCWQAIKLCTDHNLPFPDWVSIYLSMVANNMLSDGARQCSDLREILPRVLLFPKKKKRGPGRLLDPNAAPEDRMLFTIKFLCKLAENDECEPSEALEEARREMDASVADKDDKTHWSWLTQELGLTDRPKTKGEWLAAGSAHYFPFYALVVESYRDHATRQTGNGDDGQPGSPDSPPRKDR